MRRVLPVTVVLLFLPRLARACPVCFGASDGPMLQGSNMGILALLGATVIMLGAFGLFVTHLVRRAGSSGATERSKSVETGMPYAREGSGQ